VTSTPERDGTTSELLLLWDAERPRSKQTQFGMSELGGCRRRAGYRLAGEPATDRGGSVQAVMGTAIHEAIATVLRDLQAAGLIPADDLVEEEVSFAGILGHLDRYESRTGRLQDTKTTSDRWLQHIEVHGPERGHLWQINGYAAALIAAGHPVRELCIDYLARDTGREYRWTGRFDPLAVKEALAWVRTVRQTELEFLPRDYAPASSFCGHCPFRTRCWDGALPERDPRSVLYVENPDAVKWARQLWDARKAKADAEALEAEAKGALDALRPDGESAVIDVGFDLPLKWTVTYPNRIDTAAVKQEYAKVGAKPPYKPAVKPTVKLEFTTRDEAA
jgi:hypothetical protein